MSKVDIVDLVSAEAAQAIASVNIGESAINARLRRNIMTSSKHRWIKKWAISVQIAQPCLF
ncbi:MAG: hypothetical protein RIC55_10855 [Pirellulaceae bacterium]